ncbi:nitroreductase family protein [Achromobacter xylosoxidans]
MIAADFAASANKYGPRALSYVPLEAGHAAQNALLAAVACDCHAVEIGGFMERELATLLGCADAIVPITTVILGTVAAPPAVAPPASSNGWPSGTPTVNARSFCAAPATMPPIHGPGAAIPTPRARA